MKKLALLTLFLAAFYGDLFSQTCIEYKSTGIIIRVDIIGRESNIIRYTVTAPIDQLDTVQTLLNIKMLCSNGMCTYGATVSVPNLPDIYRTSRILLSDLGKYLNYGEQAMGANIIIGYDLLHLGDNWEIKNK